VVLAVIGSAAIAVFAFFLRFDAMGGALAGFDDEEFRKLARVDLVLAGERPLRDFTDGELRGVWPSLADEYPALAQRLWGRNLLTHAALTCGTLAFCAALVFLLARHLARSWLVALFAALAVVASYPHLYNYPKVLTLAVGIAIIRWLLTRPSAPRLAVAAAWTVVSALFRHDLGVYMALGTIAGIVAYEWRPWPTPVRRLATYVAFGVLFSAPSLAWVAYYEGIFAYLLDALRSVDAEGRRLAAWPAVSVSAPMDTSSVIAATYYVFWAIAIVPGIVCLRAWAQRTPLARKDMAFGVGLIVMSLVVNHFFLRANLPARFGDAVVPVVVLVAWAAGIAAAASSSMTRVLLARSAATLLLAALCAAFFQINDIAHELETGRFTESRHAAVVHFQEVADQLRSQPPVIWTEKPVDRKIAAARYLAECTAPEDRVFLTTPSDEVTYFARRLFAGGQRRFVSGVFKTDADQRRVLARLQHQSVPVVVTDPANKDELLSDYPLVAGYIESHYHQVGAIMSGGSPVMNVWVENTRRPVRTDPVLGFPCFR
jgi:hypothetical protein